jgi:hypothetical protein
MANYRAYMFTLQIAHITEEEYMEYMSDRNLRDKIRNNKKKSTGSPRKIPKHPFGVLIFPECDMECSR